MCLITGVFSRSFFVLFLSTLFFVTTAHAVGFREMSTNDGTFSVWYPSDTPPKLQRLGPFNLEISKNSPIKKGRYEIVLFSHGNSGFYRNHYLTIQALVNVGFVVIAPQHEADYLVGGNKTSAALNHRYLELSKALDAVENSIEFGDYVDIKKVHGVGYSLGGVSTLLAAGAIFSLQHSDDYCRRNELLDPNFCEDPGWVYRLIQSFRHDVVLPPTNDSFSQKPLISGKVVLVAPVFQGIKPSAKLSMSSLTVFAFNSDVIAIPAYHALPLYDEFSLYIPSEYLEVEGHHYAFISPFPKWLTEEEDIPVAKDPEGFDRVMFLNNLNEKIVKQITN